MEEIVWARVGNTPAREPFKGVHIHRLWGSDKGAKALLVEIDPGCTLFVFFPEG